MTDSKQPTSLPSSNLFALECLATTAGQLHDSEKQKLDDKIVNKHNERTNKVSVLQMAPMSEPVSTASPIETLPHFYPNLQPPPPSVVKPFPDFPLPSPFSQSPFRNFLEMMPPITSAQFQKPTDISWPTSLLSDNTSVGTETNKEETNSSAINAPVKSAFNAVSKHSVQQSGNAKSGYESNIQSSLSNNSNIPQQPPMLFRIDQPNNNSLLETLVQESQKILSAQENLKQSSQMTALKTMENNTDKLFKDYNDSNRKDNQQASKTNDDFKRAREMVLISPQRKPLKKQRGGLHSVGDVKRAYGGPPFKPGYPPPKLNSAQSAMCCLYEHTLLKMATRGFWSGDRGPLQDVFRLTRVENSDLQYNMKEITQHCYNVVKRKLEFADGEKDTMQKHMRNYVDEFDSYLERIYPVSSMAITLYLPTAFDYGQATWHGIVPTGWSEYRRAVVIREVFEVLFQLSSTHDTVPEYASNFFDKKVSDKTLRRVVIKTSTEEEVKTPSEEEIKTSSSEEEIDDRQHHLLNVKNENDNTGSCSPDQNNNDSNKTELNNESKNTLSCALDNVKYSRAFEALWTHSAPVEPVVTLADNVELKLREYLEKYPIEVYAPTDEAVIVVDSKKYKARNILGYFRRGVQLVDYSKDTGSMVIDTISTLRNVSPTSAVRKIPPGRISKLVHADLHLENYTNVILQIGQNDTEEDRLLSAAKTPRMRRKRVSKSHTSGDAPKDEKTKRRRVVKTSPKEEPQETQHHEPLSTAVLEIHPALRMTPSNEKLESIETFCHSFKDNHNVHQGGGALFSNNQFNQNELYKMSNDRSNSMLGRPAGSLLSTDCNMSALGSQSIQEHTSSSVNEFEKLKNGDMNDKPPLINQYTQTYDVLRPKPEILGMSAPDILSPMFHPPQPPISRDAHGQHMFSLHLMIDSYRRAAKYLMDTANHLELVARHTTNSHLNDNMHTPLNNTSSTSNNSGNNVNTSINSSSSSSNETSPFTKREPRDIMMATTTTTTTNT